MKKIFNLISRKNKSKEVKKQLTKKEKYEQEIRQGMRLKDGLFKFVILILFFSLIFYFENITARAIIVIIIMAIYQVKQNNAVVFFNYLYKIDDEFKDNSHQKEKLNKQTK